MFNNAERKEARLHQVIREGQEVSARTYNMFLGGSIVYGLLMNVLSVLFLEDFFMSINPIAFIIGYFASCIAGSVIAAKSNNPLISFLGYNLIVLPIGGLLTICLQEYEGADIMAAIAVTGVVVALMTVFSIVKPDFFRGMGRTLFFCLLFGIIAEIIATIMGYGGNAFNWFFVILFSLYIGYDYCKAQDYPKCLDCAIDSSVDIYLDIINLFIRILDIIAKSKD